MIDRKNLIALAEGLACCLVFVLIGVLLGVGV